ncbi:secreted RxLR effector protein 161-like [Lathyrus oleraceus]|uniref:secreted RxLR effector protein 161-like n=1 Tax=Pisum sativum TaxID=3888 RepID=UPI0021D1E1F4|nr:secreted RxLR effector protein 161-like [Pisum sativum]
MESCKSMLTQVEERLKLEKESGGDLVNSTNFRRLVGNLRYLTTTRPDIVYGIGLISRFMNSPRQSHWQVAKRILSSSKPELIGYTNNDWAGETETQKSTSGYVFYLDTCVFSWSSKKQQVVALSTSEA